MAEGGGIGECRHNRAAALQHFSLGVASGWASGAKVAAWVAASMGTLAMLAGRDGE